MRTVQFLEWDDLAGETQDKLLEEQFYKELAWMERYLSDKYDDETLQSAIDKCIEEMDRMRTPWFLGETLRDDPVVKPYLEGAALETMQTCVFYRWGKDSIRAYSEFYNI